MSIIRAPSTVNFTEDLDQDLDRADSGLDNNSDQKLAPKIQPPNLPKRDTMIRELKSKLKQKFQVDGELSEEPSTVGEAIF